MTIQQKVVGKPDPNFKPDPNVKQVWDAEKRVIRTVPLDDPREAIKDEAE